MIARLRVEYRDEELRRLACECGSRSTRWPADVVRAFRMRVQSLRSAASEADLLPLRALALRSLDGDRAGCWSIPLTDQHQLIVTFSGDAGGGRVVTVLELVDYH